MDHFDHLHCLAKNDGPYLRALWGSMPWVTQMIHYEWWY